MCESSDYIGLEGTARYAGLLLAPAEGLWPQAKTFCWPFGQKNRAFYAVLAYFSPWLVFSSNLSNF